MPFSFKGETITEGNYKFVYRCTHYGPTNPGHRDGCWSVHVSCFFYHFMLFYCKGNGDRLNLNSQLFCLKKNLCTLNPVTD